MPETTGNALKTHENASETPQTGLGIKLSHECKRCKYGQNRGVYRGTGSQRTKTEIKMPENKAPGGAEGCSLKEGERCRQQRQKERRVDDRLRNEYKQTVNK